MELSVREGAMKHGVKYDTLYRMLKANAEACRVRRIQVAYQPREVLIFDDESIGFKERLAKHRRRKENEFLRGSEIGAKTP